MLLSDTFALLVGGAVSFLIGLGAFGASYVLSAQPVYSEKLKAYECGLEPFGDSRMRFDVRYFLVSLLFLVFDLEILYLFPWSQALPNVGTFGLWTIVVFLVILTVGFVYE